MSSCCRLNLFFSCWWIVWNFVKFVVVIIFDVLSVDFLEESKYFTASILLQKHSRNIYLKLELDQKKSGSLFPFSYTSWSCNRRTRFRSVYQRRLIEWNLLKVWSCGTKTPRLVQLSLIFIFLVTKYTNLVGYLFWGPILIPLFFGNFILPPSDVYFRDVSYKNRLYKPDSINERIR